MEEHTLDLDRPRKLRYGFKAIRLIKDKYGDKKGLLNFMEAGLEEVPFFAWAGLVWEDESLTPERAEEIIDISIPGKYTILDIVLIIAKAISDQVGGEIGDQLKGEIEKKKKKSKTSSKGAAKQRTKSG